MSPRYDTSTRPGKEERGTAQYRLLGEQGSKARILRNLGKWRARTSLRSVSSHHLTCTNRAHQPPLPLPLRLYLPSHPAAALSLLRRLPTVARGSKGPWVGRASEKWRHPPLRWPSLLAWKKPCRRGSAVPMYMQYRAVRSAAHAVVCAAVSLFPPAMQAAAAALRRKFWRISFRRRDESHRIMQVLKDFFSVEMMMMMMLVVVTSMY